ncbi:uncharacterized protein LOC8265814 [Ricinus communis]|uniref:Uncharacterized protein n=1 Tax=Ricinus communis TaxID=3988 RepID=B9RD30_RICCO|nr:uncharacterized protein LOC8265814 [Ricinus communis]EEF50288.1 conserved hypothetical protein [Ricinus communis]|eukprot:XP_002511619.1 uncharacterized protein LOC8265814 [Ricinus communis]
MAAAEGARSLFCRMIDVGKGVVESMKLIAFWMWLETQGFQEIITKLFSCDNEFLALVSGEAEAVVSSLQSQHSSKTPISSVLMRVTATLAKRFLSPSVIFADKEKALKGIVDVFMQVCCVAFEDILKEKGIEVPKGVESLEKFWQVSSAEQTAAVTSIESKLNPFAEEWNPTVERVSEEDRCLFLTFSNGYPLTETQILKFFNEKYGPSCVERVYVHWPDPRSGRKEPPLFGKVVFKAFYIPVVILNGKKEAKFWVDKRPLWCKRFDPKKKIGKKN